METIMGLIKDIKDIEYEKVIIATDNNIDDIVKSEIKRLGNNADLNHIDVSQVTDMGYLFKNSQFNGDISNWDVSNVKSMKWLFARSSFNGDISNWDVSNVIDMFRMFYDSQFNKDISNWNVKNVIDMSWMFAGSAFDKNLNTWNPSSLKYDDAIFVRCPLQNHPPKWYK